MGMPSKTGCVKSASDGYSFGVLPRIVAQILPRQRQPGREHPDRQIHRKQVLEVHIADRNMHAKSGDKSGQAAQQDQKPKVDDKDYHSALDRLPDQKYDPWRGTR